MRLRRFVFLSCLSAALAVEAPASAETVRSSRYPVLFHYDPAQASQAWLTAAVRAVEDAWAFQVDKLGFPPPPLDGGANGSDDYDVFVDPNGPPQGAAVGTTEPIPGRPWAFRSELYVRPSLPISALPLVVSHELHHAITAGMCNYGNNVGEASAVYISGIHRRGEANQLTYSAGFNAFQAHPERSLDWQGEVGDFYPYGAGLFMMHLDQVDGEGSGTFVRKMWEGMARVAPDAKECRYYLQVLSEMIDLDAALDRFAVDRYFVGPLDDGKHLRGLDDWKGGALPDKTIHSVSLDADIGADALPVAALTPKLAPMPFAATYVRVAVGSADAFQIDFTGDSSTRWTIETIALGENAATAEEPHAVDATGAAHFKMDVRGRSSLVLAFVNHGSGPQRWSPVTSKPASFEYSVAPVAASSESPAAPAPATTGARPEDAGCRASSAGATSRTGLLALTLTFLLAVLRRRSRQPIHVRG